MHELVYWKACAELNVVQAALLAVGVAPEGEQSEIHNRPDDRCPKGYIPIRTALVNALNSGRLKASKLSHQFTDFHGTVSEIDVYGTTIAVEDISLFLESVGVHSEFFDRSPRVAPTVADGLSDMPPKLAAAVKAWQAVSRDPALLRNKSPKQALEHWLRENAAEFGLLHDDGKPNKTGIEEISKIANWKPKGGATPTSPRAVSVAPAARPLIRLPAAPAMPGRYDRWQATMDDEIPF